MSMVNETAAPALSRATIERLAQGEPGWLRTRRLAAWELYESMALPDPKDEAWRRTDLSRLNLEAVRPADPRLVVSDPSQLPEALRGVVAGDKVSASVILQWDGSAVYQRRSLELAQQGVIFTDIQTAAREHGELLRKYLLAEVVKAGESKFTALHTALMSGGVFLYVPRGVVIEEPLEFALYADQPGAGIFNHTLVVTEPGAAVTLVERWVSADTAAANTVAAAPRAGFHSGIVEIIAKDGSQVRFGSLQNWATSLDSFTVRRAVVEADAKVDWTLGEFGGGLTRAELNSEIVGQGADSNIFMVFFGNGHQRLDVTAGMVHRAGAHHSTSDIQSRGVLSGKARSVYRGLGQIQSGARACKTFQRQQSLVLSEGARSDVIPSLLINEHDVEQAGHAATVGQVDREHLFYLMSRGIPRDQALRLIVDGFFQPILERIPVESLRTELPRLIKRKMGL